MDLQNCWDQYWDIEVPCVICVSKFTITNIAQHHWLSSYCSLFFSKYVARYSIGLGGLKETKQ